MTEPTLALDLAAVRRILTAALPADPKWAGWVEGRIEEIAALTPSEGVVLTPEEAAYAARWLPTKNSQRARDLAARLERAAS